MKPIRHLTRAAVLAVTFTVPCVAGAAVDEATAQALARDLNAALSAATGVIADLQADINAAKVSKSAVTPDAIASAFVSRYEKSVGKPYDAAAKDVSGQARDALHKAVRETIARHEGQIVKGGPDAFVPAYFRAQVLKRLNESALSKAVKVYATNRDGELINEDWSVKTTMKNSPLAGEVAGLMKTGALEPVAKRVGDRYLGYWPMKLAPACVTCHARNGLKQTEGGFGGALVIEVTVK
jgi:hypothetical protein